MTPQNHRRALNAALALLPVALLGAHAAMRWGYTSADLALYECYAATLSTGYGYALQPGAVQSAGVAAPLWTLALAAGDMLVGDLVLFAKILGFALGAAALWLLPGMSMALSGRRRITALDLLPPAALAAAGFLTRALVSGDETGLFLLVLVLLLRRFLREEGRFAAGEKRPHDLLSALPALVLLGCRPEAPLLLAALYSWRLLSRVTAWRLPWTSLLWLTLLPCFYGAHLAGSYLLFAEIWPALITAREALWETSPGTPQAVKESWQDLAHAAQVWGLGVPLLLAVIIGAGRAINYWGRTALVALAGLNLAGVLLLTGADGGRLALPAALALTLLAAEGLGAVIRRLWPPGARTRFRVLGGGALALGLLGPMLVGAVLSDERPGARELNHDRPLLEELSNTVEELGWSPHTVSVLTSSPGTAARIGFKVIDASGLTDPSIRRYAGNRRPLELQQLIFSERRPDIIIEDGLWKVVHNLQRYPEATRLYIPLKPLVRTRARVSLAKRLVLENEPWPDRNLRIPLGKGLELLGARVEPGHLVLLLTRTRSSTVTARLALSVGDKWSATVPLGPRVYPLGMWRPGEPVRLRVPVPEHIALPDQLLEAGISGGDYKMVASLDMRPLKQQREAWQRDVEQRLIKAGDWDLPQVIAGLSRRQRFHADPASDRAFERIKKLRGKGLIEPAVWQLQGARRAYSGHPGLEKFSVELAANAYALALDHIRNSRWTSAFRLLRAASVADPVSPWIARRLAEARRRMPAGSHLVEELELEMARRALVLAPTTKHLERVLGAHMTLGRYDMVVAVSHTWKERLTPSRRSQYLLAKALAKLGRLTDAQDLTRRLLNNPAKSKLTRQCPDGVWPRLLLLQAEVLKQLGSQEPGIAPGLRFKGRARKVGKSSQLFAHCARWLPGRALQVDLYIWHREPEALSLTLNVGSRMDRLELALSTQRIRLVRRSYHLPPAAYPVRLQGDGVAPIALGTVEVGPEITFGFELPGYPGWTTGGTAFGRTSVVGRSFRARKLFGYVGERFADSYHQVSDHARGNLLSPPFLLRKSHLMMLVAGGSSRKLGVDLLVGGKKVATVRGKRSETLRLVILPVGCHRGKHARVAIRDKDQGKWGHIAVDEIRQIDGPIPGVAP